MNHIQEAHALREALRESRRQLTKTFPPTYEFGEQETKLRYDAAYMCLLALERDVASLIEQLENPI